MWAEEARFPMIGVQAAFVLMTMIFATDSSLADATSASPPDYVPTMELSYIDPSTGERLSCGTGCRRFDVPAGVALEVRVAIRNTGGNPGDEAVSWDLWFDQRRHPFPGIDIGPCLDAEEKRIDIDCWQAVSERVDWDSWDALSADRVCVPSGPGECSDLTMVVPVDASFDGSRGRGVYSFAVWVDRFRVTTEFNEFDNFAGPVRVKVMPAVADDPNDHPPRELAASRPLVEGLAGSEVVVAGATPRPYTVLTLPGRAETGFALSSRRSRGTLECVPVYAGSLTVEVVQTGAFETIIVEVRKLSTGEVLAEARGKGRIQITGELSAPHLKDDRRFEVVVRGDQGTRGARGTIAVSYPARAVYRRAK